MSRSTTARSGRSSRSGARRRSRGLPEEVIEKLDVEFFEDADLVVAKAMVGWLQPSGLACGRAGRRLAIRHALMLKRRSMRSLFGLHAVR